MSAYVDADDATLVDACRAGDAEAWEHVVRRYGALVFTVARRAGLHDDDAADVFQTVWRVAVEDLHRLREPARLGRWLARTAEFQAQRTRRGLGIARRVLGRIAESEMHTDDPSEELERMEAQHAVHGALAQLDARCRDLLRQLYLDGETSSYADVAERLGLSVGSVGPTRARCLQRLEGELARRGHAPTS